MGKKRRQIKPGDRLYWFNELVTVVSGPDVDKDGTWWMCRREATAKYPAREQYISASRLTWEPDMSLSELVDEFVQNGMPECIHHAKPRGRVS